MPLDLIIHNDWGKAGELALALEWRPQGRHFISPLGREARLVQWDEHFMFLPTKGSTLHLILPLPEAALQAAKYCHDMGRAELVLYTP